MQTNSRTHISLSPTNIQYVVTVIAKIAYFFNRDLDLEALKVSFLGSPDLYFTQYIFICTYIYGRNKHNLDQKVYFIMLVLKSELIQMDRKNDKLIKLIIICSYISFYEN